jgi:putative spermidine/putrescine transport system substrate-binding protein
MKSIVTISAISAWLIAAPISGLAQQSITVASWGGATAKAQTETMYKPFEAKTNIKVISDNRTRSGLGEIVAQVKSDNIKWDVVDITPFEAVKGCEEGLFEKIDISRLPAGADGSVATKDFSPGMIQSCAVATNTYANVIVYDREKLGNNGPKNLEDFFDTQKFPGKRGLYKSPTAVLEWALMADGVAAGDIYKVLSTPAGIDRAFKKLDTIKKDVVWWSAGTQPAQLLISGEVVMTHAWHGRMVDANFKDKKDFVIVWDGRSTMANMFAILKGSKNSVAAQEFIRVATGSQALADMVTYYPNSPARLSSMALLPNDHPYKNWLPNRPHAGRSLRIDPDFWTEYSDDLGKKFNTWLAK